MRKFLNSILYIIDVLRRLSFVWESFSYEHKFDAEKYLTDNPDVARLTTKAYKHYVSHGRLEGRRFPFLDHKMARQKFRSQDRNLAFRSAQQSGLFDAAWYSERYPDIVPFGTDAFVHFMNEGVWIEKDPSPQFSTSWYVGQNPDIGGYHPFLHYIEFGRFEGRSALPPKSGLLCSVEDTLFSLKDIDPDIGLIYQRYKSTELKYSSFASGIESSQRHSLKQMLGYLPRQTDCLILAPEAGSASANRDIYLLSKATLPHMDDMRVVLVKTGEHTPALSSTTQGKPLFLEFDLICRGFDCCQRAAMLRLLIMGARPKFVVNHSTKIGAKLIREYGRALNNYSYLIDLSTD